MWFLARQLTLMLQLLKRSDGVAQSSIWRILSLMRFPYILFVRPKPILPDWFWYENPTHSTGAKPHRYSKGSHEPIPLHHLHGFLLALSNFKLPSTIHIEKHIAKSLIGNLNPQLLIDSIAFQSHEFASQLIGTELQMKIVTFLDIDHVQSIWNKTPILAWTNDGLLAEQDNSNLQHIHVWPNCDFCSYIRGSP